MPPTPPTSFAPSSSPACSERANQRKVLIVSPSFPPMNAPDMQRVRMSLPYYENFGWEPIVLTVDARCQEGAQERALVNTVPSSVRIYRSGALPLPVSRWLGIGNLGLRAWWSLLFKGAQVIRKEKIDLVFLSNTQFVTFALGRLWRFWLGVPYVIDLQDPWRTDYYERPGSRLPPGGWKYKFARIQARLLEGWSLRRAGGLMSVSQNYLEDLDRRYSWFKDTPREVIRFGASEVDLKAARELPAARREDSSSALLRFVYTGAAGPIMPHAIRVLFGALADFRKQSPDKALRLRFEFLGTSYAAPGTGKQTVAPIAEEFGVSDLVTEMPDRLGHLESLRIQADADVLLLLGSSDLAYSPSKLYPYFLANRPILSVIFDRSYLQELLRELSCSVVAVFEDPGPFPEASSRICAFFEDALKGFPPGSLPTRNDAFFRSEYLAVSLTRRQCLLFDAAATRP